MDEEMRNLLEQAQEALTQLESKLQSKLNLASKNPLTGSKAVSMAIQLGGVAAARRALETVG